MKNVNWVIMIALGCLFAMPNQSEAGLFGKIIKKMKRPTTSLTKCAVKYGAKGKYKTKIFTAKSLISCSNRVFGDPIHGTAKACYIGSARLASENGKFAVPTKCPTGNPPSGSPIKVFGKPISIKPIGIKPRPIGIRPIGIRPIGIKPIGIKPRPGLFKPKACPVYKLAPPRPGCHYVDGPKINGCSKRVQQCKNIAAPTCPARPLARPKPGCQWVIQKGKQMIKNVTAMKQLGRSMGKKSFAGKMLRREGRAIKKAGFAKAACPVWKLKCSVLGGGGPKPQVCPRMPAPKRGCRWVPDTGATRQTIKKGIHNLKDRKMFVKVEKQMPNRCPKMKLLCSRPPGGGLGGPTGPIKPVLNCAADVKWFVANCRKTMLGGVIKCKQKVGFLKANCRSYLGQLGGGGGQSASNSGRACTALKERLKAICRAQPDGHKCKQYTAAVEKKCGR